MKGKLKDFFKPTTLKVILTFLFAFWEYFYSYKGINLFFSDQVFSYLTSGLGLISWNNFFIKNLSLVGVWVLLALVIYFLILIFEFISNGIHNVKIKKANINQSPEDYAHLLKTREVFLKTHLLTYLLWTGAAILVFAGFVFVSGLIENLRFSFFDNMFWQLVEGGINVDYENIPLLAGSFLLTLPIWYLYSSLIGWTIKEGAYEEEKDKITEDHYAVVVDSGETEEEN